MKSRHIFALLVILVCSVLCGYKLWEREAHIRKYREMAMDMNAGETEPETGGPEEPGNLRALRDIFAERSIDFAALEARNPDVAAWLYIPGTVVNYPVLWREADNYYYLNHDVDRRGGSYDGIFLDGEDKRDFSCLQNLIYGHHKKDGTMMTPICDFKNEEYFREHRKVYLYTPDHTYVLKTMACLYTNSDTEKQRTVFADRFEFNAYVDLMTRDCSFREVPPQGVDRLFSLVTCSYEFRDARTILYCYEVDPFGDPIPPSAYVPDTAGEDGAEVITGSTRINEDINEEDGI